jgi:DNA-binding MarR family transcriptional regulator
MAPVLEDAPTVMPVQPPRSTIKSASPEAITHLDLVCQIERMHRRYVDVLRMELMALGADDLSPAQVMMLFAIGPGETMVRELMARGYYLGSSASYNLKRLVESGYVERKTSDRDRRSARLSLAPKGSELCERIRTLDGRYHRHLSQDEHQEHELTVTYRTLQRLEEIWTTFVRGGG